MNITCYCTDAEGKIQLLGSADAAFTVSTGTVCLRHVIGRLLVHERQHSMRDLATFCKATNFGKNVTKPNKSQ